MPAKQKRQTRQGHVSTKIVEVLRDLPGRELTYDDLARMTGLRRDSIPSAVLRLVQSGVLRRGRESGLFTYVDPVQNGAVAAPAAPAPAPQPTLPLVADGGNRKPKPIAVSAVTGSTLVVIRVRKDGSVLAIADDDSVWKAERVNV